MQILFYLKWLPINQSLITIQVNRADEIVSNRFRLKGLTADWALC